METISLDLELFPEMDGIELIQKVPLFKNFTLLTFMLECLARRGMFCARLVFFSFM